MLLSRLRSTGPALLVSALALGVLAGTAPASADGQGETRLLKDMYAGPTSSSYPNANTFGSVAIFAGEDRRHGDELWVTDGTRAGTRLLKDINPGDGSSSPHGFTLYDGRMYFYANDYSTPNGGPSLGIELWATDGTAGGTTLVKDISRGSSNPKSFTVVGDRLWFSVTDNSGNSGIWSTNGTTEGTVPIKTEGTGSFSASNFVELPDGKVVFRGYDDVHGAEPWVSDGTAAGTRLLKDVRPGKPSSFGEQLQPLGDVAVFGASETSQYGNYELWVTDGTTSGTRLLKEIYPGPDSGNVSELRPLGSKLYFSARTAETGRELWSTDGTTEGTALVKDINPGPADAGPNGFREFKGRLYFAADTADSEELWATGGTSATTVSVKHLRTRAPDEPPRLGLPGFRSDNPENLQPTDDFLYFRSKEEPEGMLWMTDGTTAGTRLVPQPPDAYLTYAVLGIGDGLLAVAYGQIYGSEPYMYEPFGFNRALARPTVKGTPTVGQRLTASPGRYAKPSTYAYQWLQDGKAISAATRPSYTLRPVDAGHRISVRVTARFPSDEPVVTTSKTVVPTR